MRSAKKNKYSREKAIKILEFVLKKKAQKPLILDLRNVSNLCDYFVVCSGDSPPQVRAIYEEVIRLSKKNSIDIHHTEEDEFSHWLLIDFFDVVLHIFLEEIRNFYGIERLWKEAKRVRLTKKILE